jgi:hypothetical protein
MYILMVYQKMSKPWKCMSEALAFIAVTPLLRYI